MNKKLNISNYVFIILLIIVSISLQIFLLMKISRIEVIIGLNGALFTMLWLFFSTNKFSNILVILYFVPLLLLNNSIHYQLKYELLFATPLFILLLYTIAMNMLNTKKENSGKYLSKPILIFLIYYLLMGVFGVFQGYSKAFIITEVFHFLLFGSIVLFSYNLTTRDDYLIVFKALLIIFLLISFEYIFLGAVIKGERFVTFQSGFLPLVSGVLFSYFLNTNNKIFKIFLASLISIVILAMISTLTRSLWVTTVITLITVYVLNLWVLKRLTNFKKVTIALATVVMILFVIQTVNNTKPQEALGKSEKVEDRAQSIANPTEDRSFLMRVELGWYALQKFAERPMFGWGLGDILRYQVLGNNKLRKIYLDNSWFYFLWKGGIIGFVLIGAIFYRSIKVGLKIIVQTDNKMVKALVLGIIAGLVGIIALGLLSPLIIKYKTNVLFPLMWAYLEFEYYSLKKERNLT